jgi:hypothetical protein
MGLSLEELCLHGASCLALVTRSLWDSGMPRVLSELLSEQ